TTSANTTGTRPWSRRRHGGQNLEVLPRRRLDQGLVPVVFAEVVHQGVDAPSVRVLRDAEGVVPRLSCDPLTSESQEERHRVARTPHWGQIDSEPEAAR